MGDMVEDHYGEESEHGQAEEPGPENGGVGTIVALKGKDDKTSLTNFYFLTLCVESDIVYDFIGKMVEIVRER